MNRNDLMTALLDTRRALEGQVTALGERVETSRREVIETVTSQVSDLHADNRETRTRVNSASASLSEISKSLPALRQEVADLSRAMNELRTTVNDLFTRLPDAPTASLSSSASEGPDQAAPASIDSSREPDATASADDGTTENGRTPAAASAGQPDAETSKEPDGVAQRQAAADAVSSLRPGTTHEHDTARGAAAPDTDADSSKTDSGLARHDLVLANAATVGTVDLVCHRDLWDFIQERAGDTSHFRSPAAPCEEGHDRVRTTLSGRSVIGVLIAMRETQLQNAKYGKDDGTWSLATAVYRRLAQDLTTTGRIGTLPLTVVFDDGISNTPDVQ